jgi:hypothetical protein
MVERVGWSGICELCLERGGPRLLSEIGIRLLDRNPEFPLVSEDESVAAVS